MRPRVKYQIIYMNRNRYPVSVMCRFFGVSRSGYYNYVSLLDQPEHDADLAEIIRKQQIKCDKTYGYRRKWTWLRNTRKIFRNPKTIPYYEEIRASVRDPSSQKVAPDGTTASQIRKFAQ